MIRLRKWLLVPCLVLLLAGCGKKPVTPDEHGKDPQEQTDEPGETPEPTGPVTVSATQSKAYLDAAQDLLYREDAVAGVIVKLYDSKYYAVGERVLSVSYEASSGNLTGTLDDGKVTGGGSCVVFKRASAWGTSFQISGPRRISFLKNGSYYDVDRGVEPDHIIDSYDHFYNRELLTDYINSLY